VLTTEHEHADSEPTPADGQSWGGSTYGEHRAFLTEHARAYALPIGYERAAAYGERFAALYGDEPLEDAPSHSDAFPRWDREHDDSTDDHEESDQ
jgi:hypothetical protein